MLACGPSRVGDEENAHKSRGLITLEVEGASEITCPADGLLLSAGRSAELKIFLRARCRE